MHKIREMKQYPPIYEIFAYYQDEEDIVFLDSSLQNQLGHYSIVARKPYLKLVQGKQFTVNGVVQDRTFEEYIRQYLSTHPDPNETELPITSQIIGEAVGYEEDRVISAQFTAEEAYSRMDFDDALLVFTGSGKEGYKVELYSQKLDADESVMVSRGASALFAAQCRAAGITGEQLAALTGTDLQDDSLFLQTFSQSLCIRNLLSFYFRIVCLL